MVGGDTCTAAAAGSALSLPLSPCRCRQGKTGDVPQMFLSRRAHGPSVFQSHCRLHHSLSRAPRSCGLDVERLCSRCTAFPHCPLAPCFLCGWRTPGLPLLHEEVVPKPCRGCA